MKTIELLRMVRDLASCDELGSTDKQVLLALVLRCNDAGECWPSHSTLGRDCWLNDRTVRRSLLRLEAARLISVRRRRIAGSSEADTNVYRIELGEVGNQSPHVGAYDPEVGTQDPHLGTQDPHRGGVGSAQVGTHDPHGGGVGSGNLPIEDPIGRPQGRKRGLSLRLEVPPEPLTEVTTRGKSVRKADGKGTRLPAGWAPSAEVLAWATAQRIDPTEAVEAFRDHWLASNERNAIKRDWNAAFRNWLRRDVEAGRAKRLPPAPKAEAATAANEPPATAEQRAQVAELFAQVTKAKDVNALLAKPPSNGGNAC